MDSGHGLNKGLTVDCRVNIDYQCTIKHIVKRFE